MVTLQLFLIALLLLSQLSLGMIELVTKNGKLHHPYLKQLREFRILDTAADTHSESVVGDFTQLYKVFSSTSRINKFAGGGSLLGDHGHSTHHSLRVMLDGHDLQLQLHRNTDVFHKDYYNYYSPSGVSQNAIFLKGTVRDYNGKSISSSSSVVLSLLDGGQKVYGSIRFLDNTYHLETATTTADHGNLVRSSVIAYRSEDDITQKEIGKPLCGKHLDHATSGGDIDHDHEEDFKYYRQKVEHPPHFTIETADIVTGELLGTKNISFKVSAATTPEGFVLNDITIANRTECPIALVADKVFYDRYGEVSLEYMISILAETQDIFRRQLNVGLPLLYTFIDTEGEYFDTYTTQSSSFLTQLRDGVFRQTYPGFRDLSNRTCVVHGFTFTEFDDAIGLAYLDGLCAGPFRTGITTLLGNTILTHSTGVSVMAHELGHNFGSNHDDEQLDKKDFFPFNSTDCLQPPDSFIMFAGVRGGKSSRIFSPCSSFQMKTAMFANFCMLRKEDVTGIIQIEPYDVDPYYDECQTPPNPLPNSPPRGYVKCPHLSGQPEDSCLLVCQDERDPFACRAFQRLGRPVFLTNGHFCGNDYRNPKACRAGDCISEWRNRTCLRYKECCDPFKNHRPPTFMCGTSSGDVNPCNPVQRFCDPSDRIAAAGCPLSFIKPGENCGGQCERAGPSCSPDKVCGSGRSLGYCVTGSGGEVGDFMSDLNLCSTLNCKESETCVVIANNPICINTTIQSCHYLCNNDVFDYTYKQNGATVEWSCNCRSDCWKKGTCCSDYESRCAYGSMLLKTTTTTEETLAPESTDLDFIRTSRNRDNSSQPVAANAEVLQIVIPVIIVAVLVVAILFYTLTRKKKAQLEEDHFSKPISKRPKGKLIQMTFGRLPPPLMKYAPSYVESIKNQVKMSLELPRNSVGALNQAGTQNGAVLYDGVALAEPLKSTQPKLLIKAFAPSIRALVDGTDALFWDEIVLLQQLSGNKNITQIIGFCKEPAVILFPTYSLGTLETIMNTNSVSFKKSTLIYLITGLSRALMELHSLGYPHRNLKPRNIFVTIENGQAVACLGGLGGLLKCTTDDQAKKQFPLYRIDAKNANYVAPEIFEAIRGTIPSFETKTALFSGDVFSFAILLNKLIKFSLS